MNKFEQLQNAVSGKVLFPGDAAFEDARVIWNTRLNKIPTAIVQCKNQADVQASVNFVREHAMPFSIRSGGHSLAGLASCEGGLVIDLSGLNKIRIDQARKRSYAGTGANWGEFHQAAISEGLATPGATVTSVGIGGFTLGGGSGWLSRKHGLALDNLVSVKVVTAEGRLIDANETTNSELFWGIRGGAGNFGIVTDFEFQLHETKNEVLGGQIIYPFQDVKRVLEVCRELIPRTPEEFVCYPAMIRIPPIPPFPEKFHGQVVIDLVVAYTGNPKEGEVVLQPFREISEPVLDSIGPYQYMDIQRFFDPGSPGGQRWYSRAQYIKDISDGVIDVVLKHTPNMPGPFTLAYFGLEDGAISRVDSNATAFPHRNGDYGFHILAGWTQPDEDSSIIEWVREFDQEMARFATGGVYVNLLAEDEQERVKAAYGSNYDRLVELKRIWDPNNLFQCNQNIMPSRSG